MFAGPMALLLRSLRIDSRSMQSHLTRFGLIAGIYVSLIVTVAQAGIFSAPGLRFFTSSITLNAVFLTLLGFSFFSTTISEEKEEDTLGLMLMAGISPLGILTGKLVGRLIQAMFLILLQYPFTLLAVTLGGVTSTQINAAFVGLGAYLIFLAGTGVLCSTLAPSNRLAGKWMVFVLFAYCLIPFVCRGLLKFGVFLGIFSSGSFRTNSVLARLTSISVFDRLSAFGATGFGESPWSFQVLSNLLAGVICAGLAWVLFGVATRTPSTEHTTRGSLSTPSAKRGQQRGPGRVWENPFVWKDFYFVAGGWNSIKKRILPYLGLFLFCALLSASWGGPEVLEVFQFFLMPAVAWDLAMVLSQSIHDEIRGQTLGALYMLPQSSTWIVYSKFGGALLAMIPIAAIVVTANYVGIDTTYDFLNDAAALFLISHFVLVPHLACLYSTWFRWGAVSLAIGTTLGMMAIWVSVFITFRSGDNDGIVATAGLVALIACSACHPLLLKRLDQIAARS